MLLIGLDFRQHMWRSTSEEEEHRRMPADPAALPVADQFMHFSTLVLTRVSADRLLLEILALL